MEPQIQNMIRISSLFLFLFISLVGQAQLKYDYNWIFAERQNPLFPMSSMTVHFTENGPTAQEFTSPLNMEVGAACISDPVTGEMIFYTNGCDVRRPDHTLIENGEEITIPAQTINCETVLTPSRYKNLLILPDSYHENGYYLFYKNQHSDIPLFPNLTYAYVDMNLNDGKGRVTEKNINIFEDGDLEIRVIAATMHPNGKDWYVICMGWDDEIYISIVDENGPRLLRRQVIPVRSSGTGFCEFSPDGTKYACYNTHNGFTLYSFDLEAGSFSILRDFDGDSFAGKGISGYATFSASGEYVYFGNRVELYQLDTNSDEPPYQIAEADTESGEEDDQNFAYAIRGPDCKIYITSAFQSDVFHLINNPDEPKEDCNFVQQAFRSSIQRQSGVLPYYPNYNYNEPNVCKPRIATSTAASVNELDAIKLGPNPTSGFLHFSASANVFPLSAKLYALDGTEIKTFDQINALEQLDISDLPNGIYLFSFTHKNGYLETHRVVKVE